MALIKKEEEATPDMFDRLFGRWPDLLHRPMLMWPGTFGNLLQVEEFQADGNLVIKAEIPGVDPERDVQITVEDDVLNIEAERHEEQTRQEKDYFHREFRYGSFHRHLQLPEGATQSDITASYRDGVLEVKVALPKRPETKPAAKKIPITA